MAREVDIQLPVQEDFLTSLDPGAEWVLDPDDGGFGDLDINFGEGPADITFDDDSMAIEMPRDAVSGRAARDSLASVVRGRADHADLDGLSQPSRDGGDFDGMDLNFGDAGIDLGLNFGELMHDAEEHGPGKGLGGSRGCKRPLFSFI